MKIHPRRFVRFLTCCIALILAVYAVLHLMDGAYGDPPTYRANILSAEEEAGNIKVFAPGSVQYRVRIRLDDGPDEGKEVHLIHRTLNNPAFDIHPQEGEHILVRAEGDTYAIVDYDRRPGLSWLLLGFACVLLLFGGLTGLKALIALLLSVLFIAKGLIALILFAPSHILLWTFLVGSMITLTTQLVVSGANVKSAGAIIGTIGGIFIAGVLAIAAIHFTYLTGVAEASIEERVNTLDSYQAIADRIYSGLTDAHGVSELKILSKLYDLLYYHFDRVDYRIIDGKYHITTRKEKIEIEYTLTKDNKSVYTLEAIRVPEVFAEVTHPATLKLERLYSSNANAVVDLAFNMMRYHFSCSLAVNGRPKTRCPSSIHWL